MLTQLFITFMALSTLALVWLLVQRFTYVELPDSSGDYMQGRWGCGDCSIVDDCVLKDMTEEHEG